MVTQSEESMILITYCGVLSIYLITVADPSLAFRMTINVFLIMKPYRVLYKEHGAGRQKELLAHAVRLRILACRNDLNRKRIVSLQLIAFIFLPLSSPRVQILHIRSG